MSSYSVFHSGAGAPGKSKARRPLVVIVLIVAGLIGVCGDAYCLDTGKGKNIRTFNVGYTVLDLKYPGVSQESQLTVAVWYPTAQSPKQHVYGAPTTGLMAVDAEPFAQARPFPLLVFSHGYGGSGLGSVFFTEELAGRGWIVVAPDHHDKYSAVRIRTGHNKDLDREGFFRSAREIAASNPSGRNAYLYRVNELKATLEGILDSDRFGKLIDRNRIAVGGHSLGGFTALGLCGPIKDMRDDRVKAVLVFSSGASGFFFTPTELSSVKAPSMLMFGERERESKRGTKTITELADLIYSALPQPKYFLEIKGANHFSFNNRFTETFASRLLSGTEEQFQVIRRYSIAFLERYVAGKAEAKETLHRNDPLLSRYFKEVSE
jgi:predicted dienelactone hydrolase